MNTLPQVVPPLQEAAERIRVGTGTETAAEFAAWIDAVRLAGPRNTALAALTRVQESMPREAVTTTYIRDREAVAIPTPYERLRASILTSPHAAAYREHVLGGVTGTNWHAVQYFDQAVAALGATASPRAPLHPAGSTISDTGGRA